jgi:hypothetical protein
MHKYVPAVVINVEKHALRALFTLEPLPKCEGKG